MRLVDFFDESTIHAKQLIGLYDALDFKDQRTRSEWREKLFDTKSSKTRVVPWGKTEGVWRSVSADKKVLILGATSKGEFQENLQIQRSMLLQYALVMMLAAVDKILHEATVSKRFVQLLKSGKLDDLTKNITPSETYGIAMESRKRKGQGGKIKPRPAMKIKEIVAAKLYEVPFLGVSQLEKVCNANGVSDVFSKYAGSLHLKSKKTLRARWSSIYRRRNAIVHECNVRRTKKSPKTLQFDVVDLKKLRKDIDFVEAFGKFLAGKLH